MLMLLATLLATLVGPLLLGGCGGSGSSGSSSSGSAKPVAATTTHAAPPSRPVARAIPALIPPEGAPSRSVTVPVLTYHRVAPLSAVGQLDLKVDPANFLAELQALHDSGYHTISEAQLFNALYKGAPLPPKPVIISVDDGYIDDVRTILPDLQRLGMIATFFVNTGRMAEPGFLNADQIRQLDRAGMDVGDHTAHHVDLRLLSGSELAAETSGSRHVLESVLGHPVYFFAYPFGAYNGAVVSAVRAAGFTMAYTTEGGTTESTASPLTWPRVHVGRSETPTGLVALLGNA
jgi:peptidoglycan/xylan/chitin deacetylase (PgdA/CDA1 family)